MIDHNCKRCPQTSRDHAANVSTIPAFSLSVAHGGTPNIILSRASKLRTLCAPPSRIKMAFRMNLEAAREQMIEQQVRAWDVFNADVLNAMREVRREQFVTKQYHDVAFADSSIPLPHGQTMLSPSIHGRILQALAVTPKDIVLEIGAGNGYLSACLGRLASRVRSLEIIPDLAELARANLLNAAANNVAVEVGDGTKLDEPGTYDVIAVTGSLPVYDERFQRALKLGGRLFVAVGEAPAMETFLITRMGEREWQRQSLFETVIDPLIHATRPPAFVF